MSYARFSANSDVYVYPDVGGYVACCGCILGGQWDYHSPEAIVTHMQEHVNAGHKVPADLLDPSLYGPGDFIAMCSAFMCREDVGHDGPHTPHSWGLSLAMAENPAYRCPCGKPKDDPIHKPLERALDEASIAVATRRSIHTVRKEQGL